MHTSLRIALPIVVLIASSLIAWQIIENPSTARQKPQIAETRLSVQVQKTEAQKFTPLVRSYGQVKAKVSGSLIAEVAGKLTFMSTKLVAGGQFEKGEKLAQIDPRFYEAELIVAEGNLAAANFKLEEEIALGQQAAMNWKKIGQSEEATSLALRKPHLIAAKAQLRSAQALLEQAKLNLEKTVILAPYSGKIRTKYVDQGQYLTANTVLADIFGSDKLEVRLPVSSTQYGFLALNRSNSIQLNYRLGTEVFTWPARLISVENFLDPQSKQLHLIAEIDLSDLKVKAQQFLPKVGQFVEANIEGRELENVFVIPVNALYQNEVVYLADQDRLVKKTVDVLWRDERHAVVGKNLQEGEMLIVTPLGRPITGTLLSIYQGDAPKLKGMAE